MLWSSREVPTLWSVKQPGSLPINAIFMYHAPVSLSATHWRAFQVHGVETISQYPSAALTIQDLWKTQLCHEDCLILPSKLKLALYFFYAMQRRRVKYSHHLSILHKNSVFISVPIPLDTYGLSSFHVPLGPSSGLSFYCLCWLFK
jgi:hypothetical protein